VRILADECVLRGAVHGLRAAGHDDEWIAEVAPSARDVDVLERARDEDRILITNDSDFGQLVFQAGAPHPSCIVRFRLRGRPAEQARQIVEAIRRIEGLPWQGAFVVVAAGQIRMTPLPDVAP
jgi:predicted nuclease of predicted toxin-antitoxin system